MKKWATVDAEGGGATVGDVLALFRSVPGMTRAELIRRTGLSRSTINQRLDALLAAGLIVADGEEAPARGRPAERFRFARTRGVLLVADIGATGMRAASCDLAGSIAAEREVPVDVTDGPEAVLGEVDRVFDQLLRDGDHDPDQVIGIGIDVPGPVDFARGRVVSPPIMTGWDGFDIPGWFASRFGCSVLVDKDVNAMAFGEQRMVYPDVPELLMVKVGTGIGASHISEGRVRRGADGAAGDVGHLHVTVPDVEEEPLCRCGNTGCVEAYAGGWAIVRDLVEAGHEVADVHAAVSLIRSGDVTAVRLARRAGRILGATIADAVSLLNPSVVVLGGQLARVDEQIMAGVREMVYRRSLPLATRNLQIVRSRLDQRAGPTGLALLLADGIFAPPRVEAFLAS
jgi:predicted NBD/HSP70 family sugar kinase